VTRKPGVTLIHRLNPDPMSNGRWRCCRCRTVSEAIGDAGKAEARRCATNDWRRQKRRAAKERADVKAAAPAAERRPPKAKARPKNRAAAPKKDRVLPAQGVPRDELDLAVPPCSEFDVIEVGS
jgi:hypothetical protein